MRPSSPAMWYAQPKGTKRARAGPDRCCSSAPLPLLAALLALAALPFLYVSLSSSTAPALPASFDTLRSALHGSTTTAPRVAPLKIVTLAFNFTVEHALIDHNCALLSHTRHHYEIHTDDLSRAYCKRCRCVRFEPTNCTCHIPGKDNCGLCEKISFLVRVVRANPEFLFLDSDLFLVRPDFADLIAHRALDFDFLAMYDDWGGPCKTTYTTSFNTGLMFVRRLPGIEYELLPGIMQRLQTNDDQMSITRFIMRFYDRWDTLSLRWHCRFIWKKEKNIPPAHCYTFHDRANDGLAALNNFLRAINRTLLTTGDVPQHELDKWFMPPPADGVLRAEGALPLP